MSATETTESYGDSTASATRITPGNALRPEDIQLQKGAPSEAVAQYALRLGDDALVLAQRLSNWISRGPEIEEDIALGNIALDQLGHARSFLSYAGLAWDQSEDDLAYWREESEYRSLHLFEQPNGDFGVTIVRQLMISIYQHLLYTELLDSSDETISAICAKAVKEVDYHRDHAIMWTRRLGIGTEESASRMRHALEVLWPYVGELFQDDDLYEELGDAGVEPSTLRERWDTEFAAILESADLEVPTGPFALCRGRHGEHSEHLGILLAEMQVLARKHPGASW